MGSVLYLILMEMKAVLLIFTCFIVFELINCSKECDEAADDIKMQILNDLKEDIATSYTILDNKINELSKEIKSVRNPPYESYCGYNYNSQYKDSTTLTYNSPLLHSSTNLGGSGACPPGGCPANSGLSPDTGVYTCTWPGDYQEWSAGGGVCPGGLLWWGGRVCS